MTDDGSGSSSDKYYAWCAERLSRKDRGDRRRMTVVSSFVAGRRRPRFHQTQAYHAMGFLLLAMN